VNADELLEIPVFRELGADMGIGLAALFKETEYAASERIFQEGSSDDRLFFIRRGTVEIRKATDAGVADTLLAILGPGEFFGEMGAFLGEPRSADAVARGPVTLVWLSRIELDRLFEQDPCGSFQMMTFLSRVLMSRLRDTSDELVRVQRAGVRLARAGSRNEVAEEIDEVEPVLVRLATNRLECRHRHHVGGIHRQQREQAQHHEKELAQTRPDGGDVSPTSRRGLILGTLRRHLPVDGGITVACQS